MKNEFYAHSLEGKPPDDWQKLEDHLKNVAELARKFADVFGAGDWGYLAGLWHDLGKYSREFQERPIANNDPDANIETKPGRPSHRGVVGVLPPCLARKLVSSAGLLFAFPPFTIKPRRQKRAESFPVSNPDAAKSQESY